MTAGRLDRRPVAPNKLEFPFPIQGAAGSHAHVTSTGVYTNTNTQQFGPTVSWDWRLANPASGSVTGLLDASENDRVYALELESVTGFNSSVFSRIRAVWLRRSRRLRATRPGCRNPSRSRRIAAYTSSRRTRSRSRGS